MQPLNTLAPFQVRDAEGHNIITVEDTGVSVSTVKFSDGTQMVSAGVSLPPAIDSGVF